VGYAESEIEKLRADGVIAVTRGDRQEVGR
jgi:hypothetical protein